MKTSIVSQCLLLRTLPPGTAGRMFLRGSSDVYFSSDLPSLQKNLC